MIIKSKFSSLTLNTDAILKEIEKHELIRRREAAKAATKVLKKNANRKNAVSLPGGFPARRTGNLFRKMKYKLLKEDRSAMVGSTDPKIHLLEFGHGDGKERNKRPIIKPSLREAEPEVIRIMSEPYF